MRAALFIDVRSMLYHRYVLHACQVESYTNVPVMQTGGSMKRFIQGENRVQSTLFPERLDEFIPEDSPVRAIDAFVDELDLGELGFDGVEPEDYRPASLLGRLPPRFGRYPRSGADSYPLP